MKTSIALVGRPNVGKSRLFNRLVGRRVSIVHDQPGITRDVIVEETKNGVIIMDTGGIGLTDKQEVEFISQAVEEQVDFAVRAADVIFFVVDAIQGCLPLDLEIASILRKSAKKIYVIANKVDFQKELALADVFSTLGLGDPIAVSAEHGFGEERLRVILDQYTSEKELEPDNVIKVCLAGRPNVGKSSLTNALLKDQRMIISDIPGTTRDAVSVKIPYTENGITYTFKLFDTAGLREKKKINASVEFFSSLRSLNAIESSDIVYLVIDAVSGVTRQDKKLAGEIIRKGKALIVIVNKWDIAYQGIKNDYISGYNGISEFQRSFELALRKELFHLNDFPVVFVSAKTGFSVDTILKQGVAMHERLSKVISTGELNRVIQRMLEKQPPAISSGKRFKIYYAVHSGQFPHTFKVFCNRLQRLSDSYKRYLQNGLVSQFGLFGCPISFVWNEKENCYSSDKEYK